MESNIKVSVIVPIYNVEEYLEECLDSLVNQTLRNNLPGSMEVLMIDDGSTDYSGEIAKKYAENYADFHYIKKTNGGLGQARNYGINYAHGEYIAFLDSDDTVPKNAYEKMYGMAEKTGNDLIVGDVLRFNTNRFFNSKLHRKAFKSANDSTHILETPELVYDTTSWNKLYKFEWWKENKFRFPEAILYEDIPVTIPAHFKANRVSVLNEVVYYWRVRDGVNKSITQNRTDYKNFHDRLTIMKMVDEFYENNVTDKTALFMKDYKWVQVDLMLYIDQFRNAETDYIEKVMGEIHDYIKNIPQEVLDSLRTIDRMKYYLIQQNDMANLLNLLRYVKRGYKTLKVRKKGDRYIGLYPLKYIPSNLFDMTEELNMYPVTQKIQDMNWEGNVLKIQGYIYQKYINVPHEKSQKLKAKLINFQNMLEMELEINPIKNTKIERAFKIDRETKSITKYNYKWAGYEVKLDFSDINLSSYIGAKSKIEITLEMEGIKKSFYLGQPAKGKNARITAKMINGILVYPEYNLGYDLVFSVTKPSGLIESVKTESDGYLLKGTIPQNSTLVLQSAMGKVYPEIISRRIEGNKALITAKIKCLEQFGVNTCLALENDDEIITFSDQCIDHEDIIMEDRIFSLYKQKDGKIYFTVYEKSALLYNLQAQDKKIKLEVVIYNKFLKEDLNKDNFKFNIKGKENGRNCILPIGKCRLEDRLLYLEIEIDFNLSEIIGQITQDKYECDIIYINGRKETSYCVIGQWNMDTITITHNMHRYSIGAADADRKFCVWTSLIWKRFENTKQKRRIIVKYIYPLLRLLPIRKKRIIFEGWWGKKYHCNPRYLYEYINRNYPEYECIWSMNDESYLINGTGKTVRRNSLKYHFYMATAKYFVNNVNFMDSYEKRKGQIEIQTMHGTPLKTLGLDVPGEITTEEQRVKFLRRCNRWDYLIVQSKEAERITSSCFAYKKEFLRTGYPRNDILFKMNTEDGINAVKNELGIPENKKVILYAPTWRRRNKFDLMLDLEDMKSRLGKDYVLLLRIHPYALAGFDDNIVDDFVYNVSSYPSIEKLYVISDLMITDYSSAMFDYAILNRPILFFTYDLESYRDNLRGFNIDLETEAPGPLYATSEEVVHAIENIEKVAKEYDIALQRFRNKYCEYERGRACEEIIHEVFCK